MPGSGEGGLSGEMAGHPSRMNRVRGSGSEWDRRLESVAKEMMTEGEATTRQAPNLLIPKLSDSFLCSFLL